MVTLKRHADSWIPQPELGTRIPPYLPTYDFETFINQNHEFYSRCTVDPRGYLDLDIPGWLRREDALKLYELAYFARGEILELGCYHGLSTAILAAAVRDSARARAVITVDFEASCVTKTRENLTKSGLEKYVSIECKDAGAFCRLKIGEGQKFSFVFIDHSHTYGNVLRVCQMLPKLVADGGFCLFHDFNDAKNNDPQNANYGVWQAVCDGLSPMSFDFYGIFGCAALYRRTSETA